MNPGASSSTARQDAGSARSGVFVGIGSALAAAIVLAGVAIGLGLVITHASLAAPIRHMDVRLDRWFAHHRSDPLNTATMIGSHLAETLTVVGLALLIVLVLWRRRDLRDIGLLVFGLGIEVTAFLTTTLFVDRGRPPVPHLDAAPPTSSFPSGHTAAAVVLYGGLAIILLRHSRTRASAVAAIALLIVPIAVAGSRLSRGMHNPTDVIAGALLGIASIAAASRITDALIAPRRARTEPADEPDTETDRHTLARAAGGRG